MIAYKTLQGKYLYNKCNMNNLAEMYILSRYILKEHLGPFLFAFFVVTFVLILDFIPNVIEMAIGKDLDVFTILWVFVLNLAWMLALSVPMATLVATLMAFGRMTSDFEILAMKSSGIHVISLIRPVLIASLFLAAFMVWFNNEVLPDANHEARVLMGDIRVTKPTLSIKSNIFLNDIPGYVILIKDIDHKTSRIKDVTIFDQKDSKNPRTILAEHGRLEYLDGGAVLSFELEDGEIHEPVSDSPDKWQWVKFEKQTFNIRDVSRSLKKTSSSSYRGDRERSSEDMLGEIRKWRNRIEKSRVTAYRKVENENRRLLDGVSNDHLDVRKMFYRKAVMLSFQRAVDIERDLRQSVKSMAHTQELINKYLLEVHKKHSLPAACIVFVLIGAPLGILARRGGMAISIGISIALFIVYWAFLIGGEELSDRGFVSPFVAMWAANILLGIVGIVLLFKVMTEKKLITEFIKLFRRTH
jgi:lipopolysaccharide export system permease protein